MSDAVRASNLKQSTQLRQSLVGSPSATRHRIALRAAFSGHGCAGLSLTIVPRDSGTLVYTCAIPHCNQHALRNSIARVRAARKARQATDPNGVCTGGRGAGVLQWPRSRWCRSRSPVVAVCHRNNRLEQPFGTPGAAEYGSLGGRGGRGEGAWSIRGWPWHEAWGMEGNRLTAFALFCGHPVGVAPARRRGRSELIRRGQNEEQCFGLVNGERAVGCVGTGFPARSMMPPFPRWMGEHGMGEQQTAQHRLWLRTVSRAPR